jgi:hypothetical protein
MSATPAQTDSFLSSTINNIGDNVPIQSAASSLPNETLGVIFLICMECSARLSCDGRFIDSFDITSPPWTFTYVCRRWRAASTSYPKLWSFLALGPNPLRRKGITNLLDLLLSRSSRHLLHVRLNTAQTCKGIDLKSHTLFNSLCQSSARWSFLQISMLPSAICVLAPPPKGRLQNLNSLRTLIIDSFSHSGLIDVHIEMMIALFTFAQKSSSLRTVELGRNIQARTMPLPWSQLTEYIDIASANSLEDQLDNLARMPFLERAQISAPPGTIKRRSNPLRLEHLRSLAIHGQNEFLPNLVLPSLENLQLSRQLIGDSGISTFLHHSQCPLTSIQLAIPSTALKEKDIIDFLTAIPTLRSLNLPLFGSKQHLSLLAPDSLFFQRYRRTSSLLPLLDQVRIEWCINKTDRGWDDQENARKLKDAQAKFDVIVRTLEERETVVDVWEGSGSMPPLIRTSWSRS